MTDITFNVTVFRTQFPAFVSEATFPDVVLMGYFNSATCYLSTTDYGCLNGDCRERGLLLLTAHICVLTRQAEKGQTTGVLTSASVGGVSVSISPSPFGSNNWAWWLSTTAYGQELLALLRQSASGGLYIGGRPERRAFRKVAGRFY